MEYQGTVQISIQQFDELRENTKKMEEYKKKIRETEEMLSKLVESLDDEEYKKRIAIIDDTKNMSDKELDKACKEAAGTLKVIVSEKHLRELIHKNIDEYASEGHNDIRKMSKAEFDKIPLILCGSHGRT